MKKFTWILALTVLLFYSCNDSNTTTATAENFTHVDIHPAPTKIGEIPLPDGYERIEADSTSFAEFLRNLPLKSNLTDEQYSPDNYAIVELNLSTKHKLKSSDAIIYLRSKFLFENKQYSEINFKNNNSAQVIYKDFAQGDYSEKNFNRYIDKVSNEVGSQTLRAQMKSKNVGSLSFGDVFIEEKEGKEDAHTVIVVDMAYNPVSNDTIFLLAQFDSSQQELLILRNHVDKDISPWFSKDFGKYLFTPTWTFFRKDLKSFE